MSAPPDSPVTFEPPPGQTGPAPLPSSPAGGAGAGQGDWLEGQGIPETLAGSYFIG